MSTLRPAYLLDAADLAVLECDLGLIPDPIARGLIECLIQEVRYYREGAERIKTRAEDNASDASRALDRLRHYLTDLRIEADRAADDVEEHIKDCLEVLDEVDA